MQSVSSRIWIRITVSISYDDYHFDTGPSTDADAYVVCMYVCMCEPIYATGKSVMVNVLDCGIVESEFESSRNITFTFELIHFGKAWASISA